MYILKVPMCNLNQSYKARMSKSDVGWYLDFYQRIYGLEKNKND